MAKNNNDKFDEVRNAMLLPSSWRKYKKTKAKEVAGKIEPTKCEKFADYLNTTFIGACTDFDVFAMAFDWQNKSDAEKLAVTGNIIHKFVERINQDIRSARIAANGKKPKPDDLDELFAGVEPSGHTDIKIGCADSGLMSVSTNGKLSINPKWRSYNDLTAFLMDLRHEAAHIIDLFYPEISPLDPEVRRDALRFYVDGHDDFGLYSSNPLELNANLKRREFGDMVRVKIALREYEKTKSRTQGMFGGRRIR